MKLKQTVLPVMGSLVLAGAANAGLGIIAQWNFNSTPPDGNTGTGSLTPNIGAGTASLLGTTGQFNSGTGSSDPVISDDSGWGTASYPSQGNDDLTRGVQFDISVGAIPAGTTGFEVSWDQRHSNTSSRWVQFQYSTDGSTWVSPAGGLFEATSGDTWFNGRTVQLPGLTSGFSFRILATFAPSTSAYAPSNATSTYATGGTWRFDTVTVNAVPEPHEYAMLAGVGLVGFALWRRRSAM